MFFKTISKGRNLLLYFYITLISKIMNKLNALDWIAMILIIVGGLNWALVGLFSFDLVATIFGDMSVISRTVYTLVGLAALYELVTIGKLGKK